MALYFTKFYNNITKFQCVVECEEQESNHVFCVHTWRNSNQGRKADFCQHFKTLVETYERADLKKNKSTAQTAVGKVWKEMKADFPAAD